MPPRSCGYPEPYDSEPAVPLYEFECRKCMTRFEELVPPGTERLACPACGSEETRRVLSTVSPPNRQHRSPGQVRS